MVYLYHAVMVNKFYEVRSMKMTYLFQKFDFDEFNKGKLYMVKDINEKYEWDSEKRQETDNYIGVKLILEIREDKYKYPTKNGEVEGINLNETFQVIVEDAKLEDYEHLKTSGFEAPKPVEVFNVIESKYFGGSKNGKDSLQVFGDVREVDITQKDSQLDTAD